MNSLVQLIANLELDEVKVMNGLQGEAGLISDNCLNSQDVAGLNCFHACDWVLKNKERLKP